MWILTTEQLSLQLGQAARACANLRRENRLATMRSAIMELFIV